MHRHVPFLLQVQRGNVHAPAQERPGLFLDDLQGAGDAVEDMAQQAGTQQDGHGSALARHALAGAQPAGVLVDLHGGSAAVHAHHLADEGFVSHVDHIHHGKAAAAGDGDDRAVDPVDHIGGIHCAFPPSGESSSDREMPNSSAKWPESSPAALSKEESTRRPSCSDSATSPPS